MGRRKLLLVAVGAVMVSMASVMGWDALYPRPRFTHEQVDRIQAGMTLDEASAILGCPPGKYNDDPDFKLGMMVTPPGGKRLGPAPGRTVTWVADCDSPFTAYDGRPRQPAILRQARLDECGKFTRVVCGNSLYTPRTVFDRMRRWAFGLATKLGL